MKKILIALDIDDTVIDKESGRFILDDKKTEQEAKNLVDRLKKTKQKFAEQGYQIIYVIVSAKSRFQPDITCDRIIDSLSDIFGNEEKTNDHYYWVLHSGQLNLSQLEVQDITNPIIEIITYQHTLFQAENLHGKEAITPGKFGKRHKFIGDYKEIKVESVIHIAAYKPWAIQCVAEQYGVEKGLVFLVDDKARFYSKFPDNDGIYFVCAQKLRELAGDHNTIFRNQEAIKLFDILEKSIQNQICLFELTYFKNPSSSMSSDKKEDKSFRKEYQLAILDLIGHFAKNPLLYLQKYLILRMELEIIYGRQRV